MIDVSVILREYLLTQSEVTALLGTNGNNSIYAAYDLPEHFDPTLGPGIQIYRSGGHSHSEITALVTARMMVRAWADVEQYSTCSGVYGAINDVLHGLCGYTVTDGTIVSAIEVEGPMEMTDPETGWVAMYAFYQVMARPVASSSLGPGISLSAPQGGEWYFGNGAPSTLESNGDFYVDLLSGNVYLQQGNAWTLIGNLSGGGGSELPSQTYHKVSASGTNAAVILNTAGTLTGGKIFNNADYPIFVKLFNKATTPVPGTDVPQQTIGVQAGLPDGLEVPGGLTYSNGIGIAITKELADLDSTPVAADDCTVDIFYL